MTNNEHDYWKEEPVHEEPDEDMEYERWKDRRDEIEAEKRENDCRN